MKNRNEELMMFAKMTLSSLKALEVKEDKATTLKKRFDAYLEFVEYAQENVENLAIREVDTKL